MPSNQNTVVIVNPTAGRGRAGKQAAEIRRLIGPAGADWVWRYTQAPGHAENLARDAAANGAEMVVAIGGDGTLHEVANGILGTSVKLGLIPFGTGNDLARSLNLYGDLGRACRALTEGKTHDLDMGIIEGTGTEGPRHFLVLCGTGFDAQTARTVNQGVRYLSGAAAYVWGAILTLAKFSPFDLTMILDNGEEYCTKAMFATIANVETTGGGMKIAPGALCDDGLLDICLVREVSKPTLLYQLTQVFKGAHVNHPAVSMIRCSSLTIDANPPQPLLIDGEVYGNNTGDNQYTAEGIKNYGSRRMSLPLDVVIPAGGVIEGVFRDQAGTPFRALVPIGSRQTPILQVVVDTLRASGVVRRIIVVAPPKVREVIHNVDKWLVGVSEGPANIIRGLDEVANETSVLICTSDIPLMTPECVRDFASQAQTADMTIGIVNAGVFNKMFFDAPPSQFVHLTDAGDVTISCLFQVRPKVLQDNRALLRQIFAARKSQLRMAGMLGPRLVWQFATNSLSLASLTGFAERRLQCRVAVIQNISPRLAYDIDNVDDYTYARNR